MAAHQAQLPFGRLSFRLFWGLAACLALPAAPGHGVAQETAAPESAEGAPGGPAAEAESFSDGIANPLPPLLAAFEGGDLPQGEFCRTLAAWLADPGCPYDMEEEFRRQILPRIAVRDLGLPMPAAEEMDELLSLLEERSGGRDEFARRLAAAGLTVRDYRRSEMPVACMIAAVARSQWGLPIGQALPAEDAERFLRDEARRVRLQWRGWLAPLRVATADGRDYTADEMVHLALRCAPDALLEPLYRSALRQAALAACRREAGAGNDAELAAPALEEGRLRALYQEERPDLELRTLSMIYFPYPGQVRAGGEAPEDLWQATLARAAAAREALLAPGADFAEAAARQNPDAPAGGFLGLLPGAEWVARRVPPEAYALGRLPGGGNPIVHIEDPVLREAALALAAEGDLSDPVPLAAGCVLLRRGRLVEAPTWEDTAPYLRAREMADTLDRLAAERLRGATMHWSPLER